jgi:hypothetical protein
MLLIKIWPEKNLQYLFWGLAYLISYSAYFLIFIRLIKRNDVNDLNNTAILFITPIALVVINFLSMYAQHSTDDYGFISTKIYGMIACFFILSIQYNIFHTRKLSDEKNTLEQTIQFQSEKFAQTKETMDLINIKCHDLKHSLEAMKETNLSAEQARRVDEISKGVDIYETNIKTGNSVLDMVISEKSMFCKQNKIRLTPIVDGKIMSFMENTDLYSLFENALDNAIKAVMKEEEEKRAIFITVKTVNDKPFIKIDNFCSKSISFDNGIPQTMQDEKIHGFGTKSIAYIAKKYNGYAVFDLKDSVFSLTICFF